MPLNDDNGEEGGGHNEEEGEDGRRREQQLGGAPRPPLPPIGQEPRPKREDERSDNFGEDLRRRRILGTSRKRAQEGTKKMGSWERRRRSI